jgi:haloacetate dehalogenase
MLFNDNFPLTKVDTGTVRLAVRRGGEGPPLLLLHGFPQTHAMWHLVAPALARHFHLVMPDLRGYGDSAKPPSSPDHLPYSKRAMASDMAALMSVLGHERYAVAGHDRGGRVTHRMALDFASRITRACVMDIVPTRHLFTHTDQTFATAYYHWFFLIQPDGLPEKMIGFDPGGYMRECIRRWAAPGAAFDPEALAEYERCYRRPENIHSACEDYRAGASIDLEHDATSSGQRIACPLLVLWGGRGFMHRHYAVLDIWRQYATDLRGRALDCGHFLPEERPDDVIAELLAFFA